METNYDVAIIGGGIIGCSIAYYLAKEKMNVAIFEENQVASKSTSAAAGMLGAHAECHDLEIFYSFARSSQLEYFQLQHELKELSGIDMELRNGGIYQVAFTEHEKKDLHTILSLPTVKWQEREAVRISEPTVNPNIIGAAYIEDDVNVVPASVARAFAKSAQVYSTKIHEYTSVLNISKKNQEYRIQTNKGAFSAKYIVVANGVWSTSFFEQLNLQQRLIPVKGECIAVTCDAPLLQHTLYHDHCYIVPRNNGRLVVGATMVENDWNERPSVGGIEQLITKARALLPSIANMKIDSFWAGLRPQTFDQRPFIGYHPDDDRIVFATGHYRNGILLAPATGQMVRDLILKKEIRADWLKAFEINRKQGVKL